MMAKVLVYGGKANLKQSSKSRITAFRLYALSQERAVFLFFLPTHNSHSLLKKSLLNSGRLLLPNPMFGYRSGSSVYFAHLFEEFREVFSGTIVDTPCADEKSHKAFEACQRLLSWLCQHIRLDIGNGEF